MDKQEMKSLFEMQYTQTSDKMNAALAAIRDVAVKHELGDNEKKFMGVAVAMEFGVISPEQAMLIGMTILEQQLGGL